MLKILVTGGAGYIGGAMTRLLVVLGHQVTVYDNFCHSRQASVVEGPVLAEGMCR